MSVIAPIAPAEGPRSVSSRRVRRRPGMLRDLKNVALTALVVTSLLTNAWTATLRGAIDMASQRERG